VVDELRARIRARMRADRTAHTRTPCATSAGTARRDGPAYVEHLGGASGFFNVLRPYTDAGLGVAPSWVTPPGTTTTR